MKLETLKIRLNLNVKSMFHPRENSWMMITVYTH